MNKYYPMLFSPVFINKLKIKNRIAYPSLGLVYSYDRKLNSRYIEFYKERAKGGAGIVTVGPCGVDFIGSGIGFLTIDNNEVIESFQELTSIIKKAGAKSWIQLFHSGAYTHPFLINGEKPIAPSAIYSKYSKTTPKEMTLDDINNVINCFCKASKRAKQAGFDGIEIIGSAGYLISQFLSPKTNQRNDEYGGTMDKRLKFPLMLIKKIKQEVGQNFPLTIRMAGNDFVEQSNSFNDMPYIAKAYEETGINAINVTGGWHESKIPQLPCVLPSSGFSYLALNIKKAVKIPVLASNRITGPNDAEKILNHGCADIVNLGRVLIADHRWPEKAEKGKPDEIRPCIACSQGCTDELFSGRSLFCIGNPVTGFEEKRKLKNKIKQDLSDNRKYILVAGAGPGGLEAAITAKKIGHKVEIYEKTNSIGGQIPLAAKPPHKHGFAEFIRYYKTMLKKHKIDIFFNTKVDLDLIKKKNPDFIIAATGAKPSMPSFNGINDPCVISAWDFLKNDNNFKKNIAVIGGGAVGLETAFFAALKGTISPETLYFLFSYNAEPVDNLKNLITKGSCKVTVFEFLEKVGNDVGKSTKWILLDNLKKHGVEIITKAKVLSVKNKKVVYKKDDKEKTRKFDLIIIATGSKSENSLSKALKNSNYLFTEIGDCIEPGNIGNAIHQGYLAALKI